MSENICEGASVSNCESCGANCPSRMAGEPQSMIEPLNEMSSVGKVIAVVSGKGGVGKSLVTSLLAVNANRAGKKAAILDADITGPSIPKTFGLKERAYADEGMILPVKTRTGIKLMSINLMLEDETDPVVWRGPVIASAVKQFWTDVYWGDVDFMFVDLPPGTGDVPLTVFQSIPVDGVIIVTSPQDLVSMIVSKAVRMAEMMGIPVLGIVENMSYYKCPDCGKIHEIFGKSKVEEIAKKYGIFHTARLPIDPQLAALVDAGETENYAGDFLNELTEALNALPDA